MSYNSTKNKTFHLDFEITLKFCCIDLSSVHTTTAKLRLPPRAISRLNEKASEKSKGKIYRRDGINLRASVRCSVKRQLGIRPKWERRNDNVILIYDSKVEIVMNISASVLKMMRNFEFWMTFRGFDSSLSWGGSPENFQFDVCLGWLDGVGVGGWWIFLWAEKGGVMVMKGWKVWILNERESETPQTNHLAIIFVSWNAINSKYLSSRCSVASHKLELKWRKCASQLFAFSSRRYVYDITKH